MKAGTHVSASVTPVWRGAAAAAPAPGAFSAGVTGEEDAERAEGLMWCVMFR
jgi:hypothetical protein